MTLITIGVMPMGSTIPPSTDCYSPLVVIGNTPLTLNFTPDLAEHFGYRRATSKPQPARITEANREAALFRRKLGLAL